MLKKVKSSVLWLASWIVMPISVVWLLCQLLRHLPKYRWADHIFHDVFMGNFGNIINIHNSRRRHGGKNIITTCMYEPGSTHNLKLGLIYPDVMVLMIRKTCLVFSIGKKKFRFPSDELITPIKDAVSEWFMWVFAPQATFQNYGALMSRQKVPPSLKGIISEEYMEKYAETVMATIFSNIVWYGHFAKEYKDPSMPRPRLPEPLRREIHEKLKAARHGREARLCMSYNKFEEVADYVRQGSAIEDYLPAVRLLVAQGYQVLLAGDRSFDQAQMDEFDGMVVDAGRVDVEKDLFRLFAPTEADICIGDAGAGILIPLMVGIPILVLNYYPVGIGSAGTWVYPKRYVDEAGNTVPYQRAIKEDLYGIYEPDREEPLRISPVCNSGEEITEAVECFLEDVASPSDVAPGDELMDLVPKRSSLYFYGSKFSPAFIRRNRMISPGRHPGKCPK